MQGSSNSSDQMEGTSAQGAGNAFSRLVTLPPGTDKNVLISTIDGAVTSVLSELSAHDKGDLDSELLTRVQTTLAFLEQCLGFKDDEFTNFSKKRANELQQGLMNTIERSTKAAQADAEAAEAQAAPEVQEEPSTEKEEDECDEIAAAFIYGREEKILIDYAYDRLSKRLSFLRGDTIKVVRQKQVLESGVHADGVAPLFVMAPEFADIIRQPLIDLIVEKRDLFSRRVYIHTSKDDADEDVRKMYEETYRPDITQIIALGFDSWAGEMTKAGIAGLPQEQKTVSKKKEAEADGIGSSLKKVFSFGKKDTKAKKTNKVKEVPDTNAVRVHKEWQRLENEGVLNLSQHFSYSLLSYIMNMSEKQFDTEYECIAQIVNQQEEPDVGPVVTNLSRLYKFYDNIFFDLVIVVLFQRKNKFDINMLQAACMSQNFIVDRLPLTMDELRRRPMEHAKNILKILKGDADKQAVHAALTDYFYVHETVHSSKVGKRIQASENTLKRQGEKLDDDGKKVIDGIDFILREVENLKTRQEEEGVFLGEEINEAIEKGINEAVAHLN